ncbi:MAG: hypothetical protein ACW99U_14385, partial [Candidatus Thorarchaeota archaeon]
MITPDIPLDVALERALLKRELTPLETPIVFGGQFKSGCPLSQMVASAQTIDPDGVLGAWLPNQSPARANTVEQMGRTLT